MNIVAFFITNTQTPLIEQPIKSRLNNITEFAKTAAMLGITFCNLWRHIMLCYRNSFPVADIPKACSFWAQIECRLDRRSPGCGGDHPWVWAAPAEYVVLLVPIVHQ